VKHFKHEVVGKRRLHQKPSRDEVEVCEQWLELELDAIRPALVVALGATAAQALTGRRVVLRDARRKVLGTVHGVPLVVTWHPSAALRAREGRHAIVDALVDDLRDARARLG
jgi:DNA polymerase